MPTQEQIDEALKWFASVSAGFGISEHNPINVLSTAYRAEKARADLLERQYDEVIAWANSDDGRKEYIDMLARHVAERAALKGE